MWAVYVSACPLTGVMTFSLADVDASAAALREFAGVDLAGLPRAELLRLQRLAAEGRRAWDVTQITLRLLAGDKVEPE